MGRSHAGLTWSVTCRRPGGCRRGVGGADNILPGFWSATCAASSKRWWTSTTASGLSPSPPVLFSRTPPPETGNFGIVLSHMIGEGRRGRGLSQRRDGEIEIARFGPVDERQRAVSQQTTLKLSRCASLLAENRAAPVWHSVTRRFCSPDVQSPAMNRLPLALAPVFPFRCSPGGCRRGLPRHLRRDPTIAASPVASPSRRGDDGHRLVLSSASCCGDAPDLAGGQDLQPTPIRKTAPPSSTRRAIPYPPPAAPGRLHGFTGLNFVHEPVRDGELQYWCALEPAPEARQ